MDSYGVEPKDYDEEDDDDDEVLVFSSEVGLHIYARHIKLIKLTTDRPANSFVILNIMSLYGIGFSRLE